MSTAVPTTQTRYGRVKQILNRAAGASAADYDGYGRFWELPLERLLEVQIFGVRMIAPVEEAACGCCSHTSGQSPLGEPAGEDPKTCGGRSAASALIKGLRGEAPFDGSRFPRLPWGGQPVGPDDIQYISDWIDDGCPPNDHEIGGYALAAQPPFAAGPEVALIRADNAEAVLKEAFTVYAGSPNEYKYQHGELKQRMNIDCMQPIQIEKLRYAFRELYNLNKWPEDSRNYNNQALIHQNHCQHGWERFLPWHRIYLYEFEQALQDIVPDVTMPYWDWTMPQYVPARPDVGCRIPYATQAYLTEESLRFLAQATPSLPPSVIEQLRPLVGQYFYSQHTFFVKVAEVTGSVAYTQGEQRKRFIDALLAANALWYPLRYPGEYQVKGKPATINKAIHYHYPTADDVEQILSLRTFRDFGGGSLYNDAFGFLDQNPHNTLHIWTGGQNPDAAGDDKDYVQDPNFDRNRGVRVAGRQFHSPADLYSQPGLGDMFSNLTASYDPIFWPVHANVDRLWHEWQQLHPQSLPVDVDAVLTPWSYTIADTLDMYRFGYEYVKSTFIIPVGLDAPVGRFVSQPIPIAQTVRAAFHQAEVRLHHVPQLVRSCFIRVFLNLPDANAHTPIEENENYAGYLAIFGHGPCYGGPGHCDLPAPRARKYDQRPRNHNSPRNHRINVSKCAQRLLAQGASSLQVTLVVIGADYEEDNDVLRLEGVSLNFLD